MTLSKETKINKMTRDDILPIIIRFSENLQPINKVGVSDLRNNLNKLYGRKLCPTGSSALEENKSTNSARRDQLKNMQHTSPPKK